MKIRFYFLTTFLIFFMVFNVLGQGDGLLIKDGKRLFPIGWYHMPKDNASLKELADAGFNIIRCGSKEDLDRVHAVGIKGWMPMPLQGGVTEEFKKKVQSVVGHPALAIWEGPDEIILSFTQDYQYSLTDPDDPFSLHGKYNPEARITPWRNQTPKMVQYAKEKSPKVMTNMIDAISYIRSVDPNNLQVWINEGAHSAPFYVRQYLNAIDITGCDYYPISGTRNKRPPNRRIESIGYITEQWKEIGMGKPVYMILQAFSWPDLGEKESSSAYASFDESRFMAYDAIAHGARGVFYFGGNTISSEDFRQSLYALTSELDALQPFLTSPEQEQIGVYVMRDFQRQYPYHSPSRDQQEVAWSIKQYGRDWMIALVNDADVTLQNVTVKGLMHLNGLKFVELYGDEEVIVENEEFMTRMKPHEVKVFATRKKWETSRRNARDYPGVPVQESKP